MAVRDWKGCKITACNKLWWTITKVLAGVGLVALLWAPSHAASAQQEDVIESGQQQFNQRCAVCHGLEGQGDGVLGPHLKEQPADLSRLSERNGGTFPFWEIYGKIDGRDKVDAHGPDDMPVWGTDERYEGTSGRLAMGQILEIVFFLQSIQEE
jgi:mono/diheme cytochrome c family protein